MTNLPVTNEEWAATPRPVHLEPDPAELKLASTYSLKPCPFCGKRGPIASSTHNEQTGNFGCRVECTNWRCMASVFSGATTREDARTQAIANWEKRA